MPIGCRQPELEIKHGWTSYRGLQHLQRGHDRLAPPGSLTRRVELGHAKRVVEGALPRPEDAVGANLDGDVLETGDDDGRQTDSLDLFHQRSTATRSRSSGRG